MNAYYKGLDGLRAYAVILVMLFHAQIVWFGWIGVQLFFVLSGFLIAGILIKSKDKENYFSAFYMRRILRIFPLYFLLLLFVIVGAVILKVGHSDSILYLVYIQNYKLGSTNFNSAFPRLFDHTWSLAVEEQFYLVFPLIVYIFAKSTLKWIFALLIIIGICSLVVLPYKYQNTEINWTSTISNFIFLGGGAFLATIKKSRYLQWQQALLFLSAVGITTYYVLFSPGPVDLTVTQGEAFVISMTPVIMLLILTLVNSSNSLLGAVFKNRLVVYIGRISYGIYLFHYPVFVICDHYRLPVAVKFLLTFLLAWCSWNLMETKFLAVKAKFDYRESNRISVPEIGR